MSSIGEFFQNHTTKVLGAATVAANVITATDPAVLQQAIGPKGMNYVGAFLGFLTILRGLQNSQNQVPPPPAKS
jgi:hypothetical protein